LALTRDGVTVGVLDRVHDENSERGAASIALTANVSWREQMTATLDDFVTRAGPLDNAGSNEPVLWTQFDADLVDIGHAERRGQAMTDCSMGILRGRPATPDDIVGAAFYRASSDSDYLTGQLDMIDGGMVLV
jgi:NAD(P)-dependent dehydrogenase (short-subunit alcohol dehydrogenase family)